MLTPRERQALMRVIFYLIGCLSYIAGGSVPDDIGKELKILEKGKTQCLTWHEIRKLQNESKFKLELLRKAQ